MAEDFFFTLIASGVAVVLLQTEPVHGCTSSFECTSFSRPWCCSSGICCSSSSFYGNIIPSTCTTSSDCTSSSKPWCCSGGVCCSTSSYYGNTVNTYFTLSIGAIVGIVIGIIVLITACIVGCVLGCRRQNRNSTGMVMNAHTAQPAGIAPYPGPQEGFVNQSYPGQAYPPQAGPPGIGQGAVQQPYPVKDGQPPPY